MGPFRNGFSGKKSAAASCARLRASMGDGGVRHRSPCPHTESSTALKRLCGLRTSVSRYPGETTPPVRFSSSSTSRAARPQRGGEETEMSDGQVLKHEEAADPATSILAEISREMVRL